VRIININLSTKYSFSTHAPIMTFFNTSTMMKYLTLITLYAYPAINILVVGTGYKLNLYGIFINLSSYKQNKFK